VPTHVVNVLNPAGNGSFKSTKWLLFSNRPIVHDKIQFLAKLVTKRLCLGYLVDTFSTRNVNKRSDNEMEQHKTSHLGRAVFRVLIFTSAEAWENDTNEEKSGTFNKSET